MRIKNMDFKGNIEDISMILVSAEIRTWKTNIHRRLDCRCHKRQYAFANR